MSSIPSTIKAVVVRPDKTVQFTDFPGPKLNDENDIIVKVYSCAQNPTDGIALGRTKPGRIAGCDFMGTVAAIGSNVKTSKLAIAYDYPTQLGLRPERFRSPRFLWGRYLRMERGGGRSTA
jgi:hypothetical protein